MQALTLLDAMTEAGGEVSPDVVSYNTCLKACGSAGRLEHALQVCLSYVPQEGTRSMVCSCLQGFNYKVAPVCGFAICPHLCCMCRCTER